jgi:hypothetical protein
MAKFRDIAKGMKLKLPGADGQDMDFDFDNPDKMGSQIQSHVGNMMKGMMDKVPQGQQKLDMPGFSGNIDPQAMMKGIMDKMPKSGMTQNNSSSRTVDGKPTNVEMDEAIPLGQLRQDAGVTPSTDPIVQQFKANLNRPGAVRPPSLQPGQKIGVLKPTMENAELTAMLKIAGLR